MILWIDGSHAPEENMRRDAMLLANAEAGAPPVLRLFSFHPHGITLGAREHPEDTLDLERCRRDGIPWAVRPTGGRAIFHAEEWTYSLAAPIDDRAWGGTQAEAYRRASALVAASLGRLGIPATMALSQRRAPGAGAACFASAARHEIEAHGRKLVGSAQRRTRRALLQQGSVLLGDGHLRLADYLRGVDPELVRLRLAAASIHAGTWLGPEVPLGRWGDALENELGGRAWRLEGAEGLFLLTLENPGFYTAALTQVER
ncbi:MAG: hypothetical protein E6K80_01700 [Candidatus Eisenbacteria bacterium]|uniref:BPL/LPL catalytic domain-containing protein n=1 Tax=Eiseniibacteriota bacterium TaxID=2212470 RepID=A0A538UAV5_UNCEI|nr:MAG: hypothetical protein E6K80_01700 [Candidatus Eisenbacteria bacterium]